ncbi:MAG: hypothetical protein J6U00_06270 [Ruminococcus sp.]|nr:hypothetical protein [Ruminococcus sp.]MBO7473594.1 hypothetical protein [Ruminococcus sp.]
MSDRRFIRMLIAVVLIGLLLTAAHLIFIYRAYQNSSVIQFIARELWL